uniref:hypothetical protein n=1 Tax=uncultured Sphingomonas sp. TaxID=158754 RepID=UPI0035CB7A36
MANEITTTDRAPGAEAISRLARLPRTWTKTEALKLAGDDPLATLAAAKASIVAGITDLPHAGNREQWAAAMASRLDPLAAKIAPTMSVQQGQAWRNAMIDALSNLPGMVSITAAKRALHQPMQFISEVEGAIRAAAELIILERKDAIARIQWLITDLETCQRPQIAAPSEEPPTPDELAAMMDGVKDPDLKAMLRRAAINSGWQPPASDEAISA